MSTTSCPCSTRAAAYKYRPVRSESRSVLCSVAVALTAIACPAVGGPVIYLVGVSEDAIVLSDRDDAPNARAMVGAEDPGGTVPTGLASPQKIRPPGKSAERQAALDPFIVQAAQRHRIAPALLRSVIAAESAYAVHAVSPRGALGLMQLMPATAHAYGVTDPMDPAQNVDAGARHLRSLLDRFGDNTVLALAAYNAGASAVERHGGRVPPFAETLAYVPRVLGFLHAETLSASPSLRR